MHSTLSSFPHAAALLAKLSPAPPPHASIHSSADPNAATPRNVTAGAVSPEPAHVSAHSPPGDPQLRAQRAGPLWVALGSHGSLFVAGTPHSALFFYGELCRLGFRPSTGWGKGRPRVGHVGARLSASWYLSTRHRGGRCALPRTQCISAGLPFYACCDCLPPQTWRIDRKQSGGVIPKVKCRGCDPLPFGQRSVQKEKVGRG